MEKDPNGLIAALVPAVTLAAAVLGSAVDAELWALGIAGVIDTGLILAARMKTWAPATVAKLEPDTVGRYGQLPETPAA